MSAVEKLIAATYTYAATVGSQLLETALGRVQVPPNDYDLPVEDVDDECWEPSASNLSPVSGDSGDTSAAGADLPPTAPAALPTADWLAPAVMEILAEHELHRDRGYFFCSSPGQDDNSVLDSHEEWREHVGPLIAEHVLKCIATWQEKR